MCGLFGRGFLIEAKAVCPVKSHLAWPGDKTAGGDGAKQGTK